MEIIVKLDGHGLEKLRQVAASLGDGRAMQAAVEGLNEGGDLTRTQVRKALQQQTNVLKYGTIVQATNTRRAFPGHMVYAISATGRGLPITLFPYSVPGHVQASPWGVARTFARSFKQLFRGGLKARIGASRFPIRSLYGPSLPKELVKDKSADAFEQGALLVKAMVEKRLNRFLA